MSGLSNPTEPSHPGTLQAALPQRAILDGDTEVAAFDALRGEMDGRRAVPPWSIRDEHRGPLLVLDEVVEREAVDEDLRSSIWFTTGISAQ